MTRPAVVTIGVYGFDGASFLQRLRQAEVRLLVDVRQRRGVRGPAYAWANAARLQRALAEAGIGYRHEKGLAPTTALRRLQYRADDEQGVGKRNRVALAPGYVAGYRREVLEPFDLAAFATGLPTEATTALLCLEREPEACHRSLIAARLRSDHGVVVVDLLPEEEPPHA